MNRNPDIGDFVQVSFTNTLGESELFEGKVEDRTENGWIVKDLQSSVEIREDGSVVEPVGNQPFRIGSKAEFTLVEQ